MVKFADIHVSLLQLETMDKIHEFGTLLLLIRFGSGFV